MQLILIEVSNRHRCVLPDKVSGRYWIERTTPDGGVEELICVEAVAGKWVLKSNRNARLVDREGNTLRECEVMPGTFYSVELAGEEKKALIYVRPDTQDRRTFLKYKLPKSGEYAIGRSSHTAIQFSNPLVSGTHAKLNIKEGTVYVSDENSSNGTFVNDVRITEETALSPGDVISIIDLTIVIGGGFIAVNNPDGRLTVSSKLELFRVPKPKFAVDEDIEIEEIPSGHLFYRSPRMRRAITAPTIKIDPPPAEEKPDDTPLLMILGPSITMGMSSATMAVFAVLNVQRNDGDFTTAMPMVIMAMLMMTGMILFPILSRNFQKKKRAENEVKRKEKYRAYLEEMSAKIKKEKQAQVEILYENNVYLAECVDRIRNRERKLWERTDTHDDFLDVRLGIGNWPFDADYQVPQRSFTLDDDTLQDELFEIVDSPRTVENVPVVVSLIKRFSMGIVGQREHTRSYLKALIFQLAALHAYDEVKFVFIYSPHEEKDWSFVRWLPHVWSDDKSFRYVATDADQVRQLSGVLEAIHAKDEGDDGIQTKGEEKYVIFALDRKLAAKCEALNTVFKSEEYHNLSVMAVYDELRYLPKDCKVVLEVGPEQSIMFDRSVSTGDPLNFALDKEVQLDAEELALELANTNLESAAAAFELPTQITFLEMFEAGRVEHLNVLTRWKESNPVHTLEAQVGVDAAGNPSTLDLHEGRHGPHGLIAGMTGSGKSEFIMTYILSLALNYHPNEVAFVLIDYKGGGMSDAFEDLPHTVGTITNLDGASIARSLASIESELKRRQAVFSEAAQRTQVSNIDIYKYQSLFREGQVDEPLPHLFIISDEFAELKTQEPEFMEQLVSAARIGRSLGVHLILATQKPSGVVDDQIWANSRFKVCLKVQDKADSMEMIKRADAAELTVAGRYYLQVGYNELFEMGQSAWAGASYFPSDRVERDYDDSVVMLDLQGRELLTMKPQKRAASSGGKTKQLDEVTKYLIRTAEEENIVPMYLWMPPLKERIYLDALARKYKVEPAGGYILEVLMGEYDDPSSQTQDPMMLSLSDRGNLLLFGIAGGGKTHFLTTLLYSLVRDYSPDEVNAYILDFGSETLKSFVSAPHVGDVLTSQDTEKVETLFTMLQKEFEHRRDLFRDYGGSFDGYAKEAKEPVPNIVVIINNYSAFVELFEYADDDWLKSLTQQGTKFGIYFVLATSAPNAIRMNLQQNFGQRICLQVNDLDDYTEIFGNVRGLVPAQTPGRGLFRSEEGIFEFQSAVVPEEFDDSVRAIAQWCEEQAANFTGKGARPVPSLPEVVTLDSFDLDSVPQNEKALPVGIDKNTLSTALFDFGKNLTSVIMSNGNAYEDFLVALAQLMQHTTSEDILVLGGEGDSFVKRIKVVAPKAKTCTPEEICTFAQSADENTSLTSAKWFIISGLAKTYEALPYESKDTFIKGLLSLNAEQGVALIVGDSAADFSGIVYESWMTDLTNLNSGIWLGNGFGDQFYLKPNSGSFFEDIGPQFGYILNDGEVSLVKLLEPSEEGQSG